MNFPKKFICAMHEIEDFDHPINAPLMRKSFTVEKGVTAARVLICGLGFYELYVNGERITKGHISPYVSIPDHIAYFDSYDIAHLLRPGENVVGVMLGNGMHNPFGGYMWEFDKAEWRGSPKLALRMEISLDDGSEMAFESDDSFRTAPSPITFNDLRCGEDYDARLEQPGWNTQGFDDSGWAHALYAPDVTGDKRVCEAEPILKTMELKPVSVTPHGDGFLYDFGLNCAGICLLTLNGQAGQVVTLMHAERLVNGVIDFRGINFFKPGAFVQRVRYTCRGGGFETYHPYFSYYGFRYVLVTGISEEQAVPELLTYMVMNSALEERGSFSCSDEVANKLQEITRRSTLSNFHYFPTDCPHREKNGWTGDALLSAEHTLLNLSPEKSYAEWLRNIRWAQRQNGEFPGMIPTGDWAYRWPSGPAWHAAIVGLPYYTYKYRGDSSILIENAPSILRYLDYLSGKLDKNGLISFGVGDWCPPGRDFWAFKAPVQLTDTIISIDLCKKAAYIFGIMDKPIQQQFAQGLHDLLRVRARERLLDLSTMTALGDCQTSQAMAIFYGLFNPSEGPEAFKVLLRQIERAGWHMDTGILGARVLFHVLSAFGHADLAYDLITKTSFPSYGNLVARGFTTLPEAFYLEDDKWVSLNHHFFGDISGWFLKSILGINLNPFDRDCNELILSPHFIGKLDHAQGYHQAPGGRVDVSFRRESGHILLTVGLTGSLYGEIRLNDGCLFEDGLQCKPLTDGEYVIRKGDSNNVKIY